MDETATRGDIGNLRLRLRSDLRSSIRQGSGKIFILLHDTLRSQFFRIGTDEWKTAQLLDGSRTIRQVVKESADRADGHVTARFVHWLWRAGLAENADEEIEGRTERPTPKSAGTWSDSLKSFGQLGRFNPLFLKVPFPNPQPVLRRVYPYVAWMMSPVCLSLSLLVMFIGSYQVSSNWGQFCSSVGDVFAAENWICLLLVWFILKLIHESAHALACEHFGGRVTRCGLMFIAFSPIAYVDVTSAWNFRSKWQRIFVSAAGMYAELFLAGLAAISWATTNDPWVATLTRNIILSASVTTLLFNLNFLMRFDGYYILTDLLDLQNLYSTGQQYVRHVGQKYLLNMRSTPPSIESRFDWLIRIYAFASLAWRLMFYVGIVIVAAQLFHGAGIVLAVVSAGLWFALPMLRFVAFLFDARVENPPDRVRFGLVASGLAVFGTVLLWLPWPGAVGAHGIVEYAPLRSIRALTPGFIEHVHVESGQYVEHGQALLELVNPEVTREFADLELQLQKVEIERRVQHRDHEMAMYAASTDKLASLREQVQQMKCKVEALTIRSPISGRVIGDSLSSLEGQYLESGREVMSVGSSGRKEVRISIAESDIASFRRKADLCVRLFIPGRLQARSDATLARVNPRATRTIIHPALAATAGGPLPVKRSKEEEGDEVLSLVKPHFEGVVAIPHDFSQQLRAGERCRVTIGRGHVPVWKKLSSLTVRYFDRKLGRG